MRNRYWHVAQSQQLFFLVHNTPEQLTKPLLTCCPSSWRRCNASAHHCRCWRDSLWSSVHPQGYSQPRSSHWQEKSRNQPTEEKNTPTLGQVTNFSMRWILMILLNKLQIHHFIFHIKVVVQKWNVLQISNLGLADILNTPKCLLHK